MRTSEQNGKGYKEIVFTWCVPGLVLVTVGQLSGRLVFADVGMAMLSIGVFYYGKLKRYGRLWSIAWIALFGIYLAMGCLEIVKR